MTKRTLREAGIPSANILPPLPIKPALWRAVADARKLSPQHTKIVELVHRALFVCIFTVVIMATNAANADIGRFDLKRAGSRSIVQTIDIAVAVPPVPILAHGHISRVWPDRGPRYRLWHAVISRSNRGADLAEGLVRINPARRAPTDELGDIDPAVPDFTLVDPRLGRAEFFGQIALRELCFLTDGAQERREVSVSWLMLALWHPSTIAATPLDSDSLSAYT